MKYTFKCEHEDGSTVEHKFEKISLDEVVGSFESFLRGCGFCFEGYLELTNELNEFKEKESD